MNLILLLGIPVGPPAPLPPHFWLRVLVSSVFFFASVWIMHRLLSRPSRSGSRGGGGGRRKPRPDLLLLARGPAAARADNTTGQSGERPTASVSGPGETRFDWTFIRPPHNVTAFRSFDARHDSFASSNAAMNARWTTTAASGSVATQIEHATVAPRNRGVLSVSATFSPPCGSWPS